jgi:MinD-like ATPase involved in chromosome partitioning or flagellar assembly
MLIACWSPKGGTGTTVVSCGLALVLARSNPPRSNPARSPSAAGVLIADLSGDVPAVLGLATPASPGLVDWLAAGSDVPGEALSRLEVDAGPGLRLLAWGGELAGPSATAVEGGERGEVLAETLAAGGRVVVADCGSAASGAALAVAAAAEVSLLVLRPCYLALRRALAAPIRPSAVVLVNEPGRALTRRDIEEVLGVPVRAEIDYDPAIARAVDAGLLAGRVPKTLERALREAA